MKTLFSIFLPVLFWAPVVYSSPTMVGPNSEVVIPESETKKFTEDPVAYITENFDLKKRPEFLEFEGVSEFMVRFICSKGHLVAKYDSQGELVFTRQKFKNISVSPEIMAEIYRDYKGWEVTNIELRANGRGETVKIARYKILLKKEDQEKVFFKKIKY